MLLIVKTKRGYEISCECGRVLVTKTRCYFDVNDFPEICDGCGLSVFGTFVRAEKLLPKKPPGVITTASGVPGDGVNASPGFVLPDCADRADLCCGLIECYMGCIDRCLDPRGISVCLCADRIKRGECPKGWKE